MDARAVASRLFYAAPDWLEAHSNARQRRAINFWLLVVWIVPGVLVWLLLRNTIWFLGLMSLYAIWCGHLGALSAETPVEAEGDVEIGAGSNVRVEA